MRKTSALLLALVLAGCATQPATPPEPPGPVIAPGQAFPGTSLAVTWPNATGWHLSDTGANQWVFQKQGAQADDSFIATISWLDLPTDLTTQSFVTFVKQGADAQNQARFHNLASAAQFSSARPYPCVHYRATGADAPTVTAAARPLAPLLLEMELLACAHPQLGNKAFVAVYSHHGERPDPGFETGAAAFFGGIQVPAR